MPASSAQHRALKLTCELSTSLEQAAADQVQASTRGCDNYIRIGRPIFSLDQLKRGTDDKASGTPYHQSCSAVLCRPNQSVQRQVRQLLSQSGCRQACLRSLTQPLRCLSETRTCHSLCGTLYSGTLSACGGNSQAQHVAQEPALHIDHITVAVIELKTVQSRAHS